MWCIRRLTIQNWAKAFVWVKAQRQAYIGLESNNKYSLCPKLKTIKVVLYSWKGTNLTKPGFATRYRSAIATKTTSLLRALLLRQTRY